MFASFVCPSAGIPPFVLSEHGSANRCYSTVMANRKSKRRAPQRGGTLAGAITLVLGVSAAVAFWSNEGGPRDPAVREDTGRGLHRWHLNLDRGSVPTGESMDALGAVTDHDPLPSFRIPSGPPTITADPVVSQPEADPLSLVDSAPELSDEGQQDALVPIESPLPQVPVPDLLEASEVAAAGETQSLVNSAAKDDEKPRPAADDWQRPPVPAQEATQPGKADAEAEVSDGEVSDEDCDQVGESGEESSQPPRDLTVWGRVLDLRGEHPQASAPVYRLQPRNR